MKRTRTDFERLIAELGSDIQDQESVAAENRRAWDRVRDGATDPLDPERTRLVQEKTPPAVSAFTRAHRDFVEQLRKIADVILDSE